MSKTPARRSVHWWTWDEYSALQPGLADPFGDWSAVGWKAAGRLALTAFVDGSHLMEVPMRRTLNGQTVSVTRRFEFPADEDTKR